MCTFRTVGMLPKVKTIIAGRIRLTLLPESGMIDGELQYFLPSRNGQAR